MDYKKYSKLLERYHKLDTVEFEKEDTKENLIKKLMDVSYGKKQIQIENNAIIKEYIEKYEKSPELLDSEAEEMLNDFSRLLTPNNQNFLDTPIAFRISKLLLRYYQDSGNLEKTISMLERCAVFDIMVKEHLDDYAGSAYTFMAEQYLPDFGGLSENARRSLVNCWLLSVVNRKDMTFGLKRYREIREQFAEICQKAGEQFMRPQYIMCKMNALAFAMEACRRAEYVEKSGKTLHEPMIDIGKEAPLIEELKDELQAVLDSDDIKSIIYDRVVLRLYCAQASYHIGQLSLEELLERTEEYARFHEDYNPMEKISALFTANAYYMDYLYKCSRYDEKYVLEKSMKIIGHVMDEYKKMVNEFGNYQTNSCLLMLVNSASNIVDFAFFKSTVLNATVYANKPLYVHTMMVKEICAVILEYILKNDPQYLDGVAGYSWEYCNGHKKEIMELMENCALFHDIGKYFCLDYVSNSSRNLTDDEFEVFKAHPYNYSKIYQGETNPAAACIRDCALLHHVWCNGSGGYPKEKHTANQPFVNILSIADSIDAATDSIGRPYGLGKTLEQLMEEFDSMKDTRYSGYIGGLLHVEEVKKGIEYVINVKRKEIYCDIYLGENRLR